MSKGIDPMTPDITTVADTMPESPITLAERKTQEREELMDMYL
jgi:hypothetical protein